MTTRVFLRTFSSWSVLHLISLLCRRNYWDLMCDIYSVCVWRVNVSWLALLGPSWGIVWIVMGFVLVVWGYGVVYVCVCGATAAGLGSRELKDNETLWDFGKQLPNTSTRLNHFTNSHKTKSAHTTSLSSAWFVLLPQFFPEWILLESQWQINRLEFF